MHEKCVIVFLKTNRYKYEIMIIFNLIFVIRNSAFKMAKKWFSIILLIQKLINSLKKMMMIRWV